MGLRIRVKVAYVITRSDSVGGAHIHVRDLCRELIRIGQQAVVLVGQEGPFTRLLAASNIPYRPIPSLVREIHPPRDIQALQHIVRELRNLKPDIVSTHSSKAGWLGRLAAKLLRVPVIFTAHGWAFTEGVPNGRRRLYVVAERVAAKFADRIITVSDFDRRLALSYRVAPTSKLITIHNGMPDILPKYMSRPAGNPPQIIMVARFEEQKDHKTLLEALALLQDLPWRLELVGDGPLRDKIEKLAKNLGIRQRVNFVGAINDVAEHLSRSHIFVLTSRWEGFPRSVLEAMRAGLPVIASDVGGVAEAVADSVTGFLVPRGDVRTLKQRLELLLQQPEKREVLGRNGRKRFEQEFTFDRMFERTLNVYQNVLADSSV